ASGWKAALSICGYSQPTAEVFIESSISFLLVQSPVGSWAKACSLPQSVETISPTQPTFCAALEYSVYASARSSCAASFTSPSSVLAPPTPTPTVSSVEPMPPASSDTTPPPAAMKRATGYTAGSKAPATAQTMPATADTMSSQKLTDLTGLRC